MKNKELHSLCDNELKDVSEDILLKNGIKSLRLIQEGTHPTTLIIEMKKSKIRVEGKENIISKIKEIKGLS